MAGSLPLYSDDRKFFVTYWRDIDDEYSFSAATVARTLGLEDKARIKDILELEDIPWVLDEQQVTDLATKIHADTFFDWFTTSMSRLKSLPSDYGPVTLKDISRKLDQVIELLSK